jgi:hypothetical protein
MGVIERFNRTMVAFLTKNCDISQADWEVKLPAIMWQYNSTRYSITGFTPELLQIGRAISTPVELKNPFDLIDGWDKEKWTSSGIPQLIKYIAMARENTHKSQKETAEKSINKCMKQGIKVLVEVERKTNLDREEHHKLLPLWDGPYELVGERMPLAEYTIKVDGEEKPCRVERMKIYKEHPAYLCPSISLKEFPTREEVEARDPKDKDYVQEPENSPTGGQENSAEAIMEEKENLEESNKQPQESRRASKRLVEMKRAEYVIGD